MTIIMSGFQMNNAQIVATGGQAAQGLQYRAIFTSFLVKCPFK